MVLKKDNVPLSLRDTGYCHSDHKVSLQVHKVTLTNTICSVLFQEITKYTSCSQIRTELLKMMEITQVKLYWMFQGEIHRQTIAIPPMFTTKSTVAIYMCIDEYILAIFTHLK